MTSEKYVTVIVNHCIGYVRTVIVDIVYGIIITVYAGHSVFASGYPHVAFEVFDTVADKPQRSTAGDGYRLECQCVVIITQQHYVVAKTPYVTIAPLHKA